MLDVEHQDKCLSTTTGISRIFSATAARKRPLARDDLMVIANQVGFTNPNCWIDLAICSICSGEWMRGFVGLGESRAMGQ